MGERTTIEWCDATWNPVIGCTRPPEKLDKPLHWRKPRRISVCSMSDLFHKDVPEEYIDQVFAVMAMCPQHTFQVLTKQPERMREYLTNEDRKERIDETIERFLEMDGLPNAAWEAVKAQRQSQTHYHGTTGVYLGQESWIETDWPWPLPNVWLGVSVEDQCQADERIPLLLQVPAVARWLSMEPLLGPVDLTSVEWPNKGGHRVDVLRRGYWNAEGWIYGGPSAALGAPRGMFTNHSDMEGIDWVVAGSESGPGARWMDEVWIRQIRDQCVAAGVPFFYKQRLDARGRKVEMPELDGRRWDEYPGG